MVERRRLKQSMPLNERLAVFAEDMRKKASLLKPGREQEELLSKARQADAAAGINGWAYSSQQESK